MSVGTISFIQLLLAPPPIADPTVPVYTFDNPNAYDTSFADWFGRSVGVCASYAIVGADGEDDAGGTLSGKAYIYNNATGALLWTLDNPNAYGTSAGNSFGFSVAISESYAIVGAYSEDDAGGGDSGKAYIFNPTTGALLWTLDNPNAYGTSAMDFFGYSVAISGSYAIVGAHNEDEGGLSSGKAYIFNPATGALLWTLNNPNAYSTPVNDRFGWSVAISESYAIVGARDEDDAGGGSSGKAYIFDNATGALLWTLNNPNAYSTSANDFFGYSVGISETYAIVGAYTEDDAGGTLSGKAYIFNPATGGLLWTLNDPNAYDTSATDRFGYSVAISESYAIVGAYTEDDAGGTDSGKAYIFNPATGGLLWTLDNPNAYDTSSYDYFGYSVGISDSYAIVGAYNEDDAGGSESGKAYMYMLSI
jgi:outer membrane protein assembly factor BamB